MSLEPYCYRPGTPPDLFAAEQLINTGHSRNASDSSAFTIESSPDSVITTITTPSRSPIRQHGPALLPKIRSQDHVVEPSSAGGPMRGHRRVLSNVSNPRNSGYAPYPTTRPPMQRSVTEPADCVSLISPISNSSFFGSRASSALPSPVTLTASHSRKPSGTHSRSGSASSIDDLTLSRYGYPTYRQMPTYVSQPQYDPSIASTASTAFTYTQSNYQPNYRPLPPPQPQPQPVIQPVQTYSLPIEQPYTYSPASSIMPTSVTSTTTNLLSYLTAPTQVVQNLVTNVTFYPGKGLHSHFWWDIRNLRSWDTFSIDTMRSIPGLFTLLSFPIDSSSTPAIPLIPSTRLSPTSEASLSDLIRDIYAPRINAALALSQGAQSHMSLYPGPDATGPASTRNGGGPHFLTNYASDSEVTLSGSPRGRVVGLVKSFDRWNSGMRQEAPHKKVEYLNGLSHLQRCMREHNCRYGFIITEIELVCVRAGTDESDTPYFGFLELAARVETKTSSSHSPEDETPMTVPLALYFLLMLAKRDPLPTGTRDEHTGNEEFMPSGKLDFGRAGALTRQFVHPAGKDKWIPEPNVGEKRDAKRKRGWVLPGDPWHRREGSGGRSRGGDAVKVWHK